MRKPRKLFKTELHKHGGCEDCTRECRYNSKVCHKDVAELTKGIKFPCNDTK